MPESAKSHIGTLEAAVLGLLALMLGFSFAMSLSRYDTRRDRTGGGSATAIDTTYLAHNYCLRLIMKNLLNYCGNTSMSVSRFMQ